MTVWNYVEFQYIGRLVLAAICGILIGYERKNRAKEAGVRTHCVVACASALMMVLSKYAYSDIIETYGELSKVDPSRVASGVVSGIGFLGAGMIFVHKKTVTGLTTAAGIWATSGIGMAIGAGMYVVGIGAALIILLIQVVLHMSPRRSATGEGDEMVALKQKNGDALLLEALQKKGIPMPPAEETENGDLVYTITVTVANKAGKAGKAGKAHKAEKEKEEALL